MYSINSPVRLDFEAIQSLLGEPGAAIVVDLVHELWVQDLYDVAEREEMNQEQVYDESMPRPAVLQQKPADVCEHALKHIEAADDDGSVSFLELERVDVRFVYSRVLGIERVMLPAADASSSNISPRASLALVLGWRSGAVV